MWQDLGEIMEQSDASSGCRIRALTSAHLFRSVRLHDDLDVNARVARLRPSTTRAKASHDRTPPDSAPPRPASIQVRAHPSKGTAKRTSPTAGIV
jgi:hypothetical protein